MLSNASQSYGIKDSHHEKLFYAGRILENGNWLKKQLLEYVQVLSTQRKTMSTWGKYPLDSDLRLNKQT